MVDTTSLGLGFIVMGIIFIALELGIPGFFIAIPGTVFIVLGIIELAVPELFYSFWSPVLAAITAVIVTVIVMKFYQRLAPPEPPTTTVGTSLIGREGTVTSEVIPHTLRGKVRIGSEIWSATAHHRIHPETRVKVVRFEGVHVIVEELKETKERSSQEAK